MENKLVWNVYVEDFNDSKIVIKNIFELSIAFDRALREIKEDMKNNDREWFFLHL